jgi:hypothetical protein
MTASPKHGAKTSPGPRIYLIEVVLDGIKPRIWRQLQVPGDARLGWLHAVIQIALGWTNSHLHQFNVGNRVCSDPTFELNEFEDDPPVLDENRVTLMDIASKEKDGFSYEYDFGDSWRHRVTVKKILPPDPTVEKNKALCLAGARACPPEDCGGVWGYADLLKVIRNPENEEYESMMEWLGGSFDPDAFDREKINSYLRKLKWPSMTIDQLARILMQRDSLRR